MSQTLGETAAHLPGLCPCAATLSALARASTDAWVAVRSDPALVLLTARRTAVVLARVADASFATLIHDPAVLEGALPFLDADANLPGFVNWADASLQPIHTAALAGARLAHALAGAVGECAPENAWAAALLAPLGWFAVCAVEPHAAVACLHDPAHPRHAEATEQRHWGLDAAALGRRLAQHWQLPRWLAAVVGHLSLPVEVAERLGADPEIFRIVQLAVSLVQQRGHSALGLPVRPATSEVLAALGLSPDDVDALLRTASTESPSPSAWEPPHRQPLLRDVLALAVENRRLKNVPVAAVLQRDLDELHQALAHQLASEGERLRAQKLSALAEFAAGAGHEINNPLAVISGQAQYLLKKIADCRLRIADSDEQSAIRNPQSAMAPALNTIIQQTKRIHQVLTELMQFARPPRLQKEAVDMVELAREVAASLHEPATRGQVQLLCPEAAQALAVYGDRQQLRTALTCLLRNAVESAPPGGWAGVRVEASDPEFVDLVVEDNGTGPAPVQREHLFDPFYSGRHAGRGRGLGLPTAWRLAREHGGDVRFECRAGGPTRFVLSLPRGSHAT